MVATVAWPRRSVGPPVETPITTNVVRIVLGHPRKGVPAVRWTHPAEARPSLDQLVISINGNRVSMDARGFAETWLDVLAPDLSSTDLQVTVCPLSTLKEPLASANIPACTLTALVTPSATPSPPSQPVVQVPLVAKTSLDTPVAQLTLHVLVATPAPVEFQAEAPTVLPATTPIAHDALPKFAGHRGCGGHGTTVIPENTLLSFSTITASHPSITHVELDVQLADNNTPIIYHDFFLPRALTYDRALKPAPPKVPLYTTSLDTFQSGHAAFSLPGSPLHRLPTLRDVAGELPASIGLLVELKYPTPEDLAAWSLPYPLPNTLVDATLAALSSSASGTGRDVAFLSFDADLVALLRLKQTRYPVYFLNSESREDLNDAYDPRTTTFHGAVGYAGSVGATGMVLLAEMAVEDKGWRAREVREAGLRLMTYGKRNMEVGVVRCEFDAGVEGVIVDRADEVARAYFGE